MKFRFGKNEEKIKAEVREFVRAELPENFIGKKFEEETSDENWEFAMSMSKKLAKKGWLTIAWPKEYGGMGASQLERAAFIEEATYWGIPGLGMGVSGTSWVGPSLMLIGTEEQKSKYIPLIAAGDPDGVWCTGYSEPDAGSDMASMQTTAIRDGDDYVINGQKVWTSCAHYARYLWLACRTDPESKKHRGLSLFIVDMKSEGLTVRPLKNYVGGHVFNELFFKDVRVPAKNLVGTEGKGWSHLMTALSFERGIAVGVFGAARRVLDELIWFAKSTGQFKNPMVRHKLADLYVDIQAGRLLGMEAAWKMEQGKTVLYEPSRDKANGDILHEKLSRIGSDILGVYSMMDPEGHNTRWARINCAIEHLYHYCPGLATAAGTTDTQRNIIGQFHLQLPKAY